jgi:hypothetical protein
LVVWASATNKDFDLVSDQLVFELLESLDDSLEGRSHVGEIGDTTTDDEDFAFRVRRATGNKID